MGPRDAGATSVSLLEEWAVEERVDRQADDHQAHYHEEHPEGDRRAALLHDPVLEPDPLVLDAQDAANDQEDRDGVLANRLTRRILP
jgi:hypothetical protein